MKSIIARGVTGFREVHCCVNFIRSFTAIEDCVFQQTAFCTDASTKESRSGF